MSKAQRRPSTTSLIFYEALDEVDGFETVADLNEDWPEFAEDRTAAVTGLEDAATALAQAGFGAVGSD